MFTITRTVSATAIVLACMSLAACGGSTARTFSTARNDATSSTGSPPPGGDSSNAALQAGGDSSEAVVKIGGRTITKAMLEHMMMIGMVKKELPDPPNYKNCIAHLEASAPKQISGQKKPTGAELKSQCQHTYEELKGQALHTLIVSEWVLHEAVDLGLKVSDQEVKSKFEEEKNKEFKNEADFKKFLKNSGQTVSDLLLGFKVNQAAEDIRALIRKRVGTLTQARIASYYNTHKQRYTVPEQRDIEAIRTWTRSAIEKAKREVKSGISFASVAKRVSIDRPSNEHGGATLGVVRGQEEKGYDEAIFVAEPHVLTGPLHLRKRYYIFEVTSITPPRLEPFAEIEASITRQLPAELQQQALVRFIAAWREKWTSKTYCSPGYVVQKCKQYKVSSATPPEDPYTFG